jgi:hypothetical protein
MIEDQFKIFYNQNMKRGGILFLFMGLFFSGCGCERNAQEGLCCGKVVFTVSVSNGKETRVMDCKSNNEIQFCFFIENPRFIPFDKSCNMKNFEAIYMADYGDGSTDVVEPDKEFCHSFGEGEFKISVTSIPKAKNCESPVPYTSYVYIGVVECPYPLVKYIGNSCCLESWCELNPGQGCDLHIEAGDIYNQPLTYCWKEERNGVKIFEECGPYSTKNFIFSQTGLYKIGGEIYNSCGCSVSSPENTFEVYPYVEPLSSAITVELGISDVYPRRITDDLFIYLSTSAGRWIPTIGKIPKSPSILIYHAPATEPWKMELIDVYHGDESKGELQFSDNGYLHMNGEGGGVYVFAATYPGVITPIPSKWKDINSESFQPSEIYVEGITGFLVEENTAYSVSILDPLNIMQTDRIVQIDGCGLPKHIFSLLPLAFISQEKVTDSSCGVGVYDYDLVNYKFGEYQNPDPVLLLGIPNCSSTNYCMIAGMNGIKIKNLEDEFYLFAGINRKVAEYDYGGYLRMWKLKRYGNSITYEVSSEIGLLNDIGGFTAFSDLKVLTCDAPVPGFPPSQYLELIDFSNPSSPQPLISFEIMQKFGFSTCLRIKGYEADGVRAGFVITGAELGVVDFSQVDNPQMRKILFFSGELKDIREYRKDSKIYLLLSLEKSGIMIYDVTDINNPSFVSSFQDGKNFGRFILDGDILYTLADDGIEVLSLADIIHPSPLTFFRPPNYMNCITKEGNYIYAGGWDYLGKIDVSDPSNPREVQNLSVENPVDCEIDNGLIVVLSDSGRFYLFKADPFEFIGEFRPSYIGSFPESIYLKDGILFIGSRGYLTIYDLSSPSSPVLLSYTFVGGEEYQIYDMALLNNYLFLAIDDVSLYGTDKGYGYVYDVTDPTLPIKHAKFNTYDVNRIFAREEGGIYYIYLGTPSHNAVEIFKSML